LNDGQERKGLFHRTLSPLSLHRRSGRVSENFTKGRYLGFGPLSLGFRAPAIFVDELDSGTNQHTSDECNRFGIPLGAAATAEPCGTPTNVLFAAAFGWGLG